MFPRLPARATFVADTNFVSGTQKCFLFCSEKFCVRNKCFPVCPRAQHLLRTQNLCPAHKIVSDFVQKHFVSATNVSQFARARKRHEQQCFRNNVSSFATALTVITFFIIHSKSRVSISKFCRDLMYLPDKLHSC